MRLCGLSLLQLAVLSCSHSPEQPGLEKPIPVATGWQDDVDADFDSALARLQDENEQTRRDAEDKLVRIGMRCFERLQRLLRETSDPDLKSRLGSICQRQQAGYVIHQSFHNQKLLDARLDLKQNRVLAVTGSGDLHQYRVAKPNESMLKEGVLQASRISVDDRGMVICAASRSRLALLRLSDLQVQATTNLEVDSLQKFEVEFGPITDATISPDGAYIACISLRSLWVIKTENLLIQKYHAFLGDIIPGIHWSPDSAYFLVANKSPVVGIENGISDSPQRTTISKCSADSTWKPSRIFETVNGLNCIVACRQSVFVGLKSRQIIHVPLQGEGRGNIDRSYNVDVAVTAIASINDHQLLVAGTEKGDILIFWANTGTLLNRVSISKRAISRIDGSNDGRIIAVLDEEGSLFTLRRQ